MTVLIGLTPLKAVKLLRHNMLLGAKELEGRSITEEQEQ